MRKTGILLLTLLFTACAGRNGNHAVQQLLDTYPAATVQDVYKTFFQDHFGPGHMITDTAWVRAYLAEELAIAAEDSVVNPYYEPTGAEGRYMRVYLRCVNEGLLTEEQLLDAFLRSADNPNPTDKTWEQEWSDILSSIGKERLRTLDPDSVMGQLAEAAKTNRAVRHSEAYRQAYHPHYRVVKKEIFENELFPDGVPQPR